MKNVCKHWENIREYPWRYVLNLLNYMKKSANTDRIYVNIHGKCSKSSKLYEKCLQTLREYTWISMEITSAFKAETFFTLQGDLRQRAIRLSVSLPCRMYRSTEKHACCLFQQVLGTNQRPRVMPMNLVIPISSNFTPTGKF
jgi:hypothetical protein